MEALSPEAMKAELLENDRVLHIADIEIYQGTFVVHFDMDHIPAACTGLGRIAAAHGWAFSGAYSDNAIFMAPF